MSLLTETQGTPERVWSSINAVGAVDGPMARDELWALLNPKFLRDGVARELGDGIAHRQAVGASVSLGLLELEGGNYRLAQPLPANYAAFSDAAHDRLCSISADDADYLLFEAFAWMSLKIDQDQSLEWTSRNADSFANAIEADVGNPVGGDLRYNGTKITAWRRWIQFLDLAVDLPGGLGFYPCIAGRVLRELSRSDLARNVELPVNEVLAALAHRMPYIDGGILQATVARQIGVTLDRSRVSRLLSMALRDLADEGILKLHARGDASGFVELAADERPAATVLGITLQGAVL